MQQFQFDRPFGETKGFSCKFSTQEKKDFCFAFINIIWPSRKIIKKKILLLHSWLILKCLISKVHNKNGKRPNFIHFIPCYAGVFRFNILILSFFFLPSILILFSFTFAPNNDHVNLLERSRSLLNRLHFFNLSLPPFPLHPSQIEILSQRYIKNHLFLPDFVTPPKRDSLYFFLIFIFLSARNIFSKI